MIKYLLLLGCFFVCSTLPAHSLFNTSKLLTQEDIIASEEKWSTHFTWEIAVKCISLASCSFAYEHQKAGFIFKFLGLPIYKHNYRLVSTWQELKERVSSNYYFAEPFEVKKVVQPRIMDAHCLSEYLLHNKVVFYTGAGISAASQVPAMQELQKSLNMDQGIKHFVYSAWSKPQKAALSFKKFCVAAIHNKPTPAHCALKDIAVHYDASIITENVDLLHQRSGIEPVHASDKRLKVVDCAEWCTVNALVCIGLSHDDRGFIAYYKQCNPQGIIVAIDLHQPNYLTESDYWCEGDLQLIIPAVLDNLR